MMEVPSNKTVRRSWRRGLFWTWVVGSGLVAFYIGVADPFSDQLGRGSPAVALALPALMFFMLASGLGRLVLLVTAPRR